VWCEPGPTQCFTDTAGTTLATAGQAVAKIIDLSAGRSVIQAPEANRPTLQQSGNLYFLRHDGTDYLTATLPALSGGNYSTTASVYFGTPQGMSSFHGQTIATTYNLPAPNTDVYGWCVVPSRLLPPEEEQLARYFRAKAGIVGSEDYFWQEDYGPELVTNGDFSQGSTGWTMSNGWAIESGTAKVVTPTGQADIQQSIATIIGKTYELKFHVVSFRNSGAMAVQVSGGMNFTIISSLGTSTFRFISTASSNNIDFRVQPYGVGTSEIDTVSIRELKDGINGFLTADDGITRLLRA
jgi:hypothetical protein